jgi:hypothetical protein
MNHPEAFAMILCITNSSQLQAGLVLACLNNKYLHAQTSCVEPSETPYLLRFQLSLQTSDLTQTVCVAVQHASAAAVGTRDQTLDTSSGASGMDAPSGASGLIANQCVFGQQ